MSADSSSDGFSKLKRPIFGDLTNQQGKRPWTLISDNLYVKIGDGFSKHVNDEERDLQFAHKVCLGAENIVKEKCSTNCVVSDSEKGKRVCVSPRPCSEIQSLRGNIVSGISKIPSDVKESFPLNSSSLVGGGDVLVSNFVEVGDPSRDSCVSSISVPVSSALCVGDLSGVGDKGDKDEERVTSRIAESDVEGEQLVTLICQGDGTDVGVGNLVSDKHASVGCSRLSKSQSSKSFELERCTGLKDDGSSNSNGGIELMKACSCPFCTKAAYIWSDLYYQDMKGRIAALKKSQKEAGILVQRSCRDKGTDKHGQGNSNKNSKLESDLNNQWRSLFLHMEDIFVRESSQLESSLIALKDLRETCKMDLEIINGKRSEKH